jgi:hypothetical protein
MMHKNLLRRIELNRSIEQHSYLFELRQADVIEQVKRMIRRFRHMLNFLVAVFVAKPHLDAITIPIDLNGRTSQPFAIGEPSLLILLASHKLFVTDLAPRGANFLAVFAQVISASIAVTASDCRTIPMRAFHLFRSTGQATNVATQFSALVTVTHCRTLIQNRLCVFWAWHQRSRTS